VIRYPKKYAQSEIYLSCARDYASPHYEFAAFFDVDEFLVLRNHSHIAELLEEFFVGSESIGAISFSWFIMHSSGREVYEPFPVTYRFQNADEESLNIHVKSVVHLPDMNMSVLPHPHFPVLQEGKIRVNTRGEHLDSYFDLNPHGDVAILYHYGTKSLKEYIFKRLRGVVANPGNEEDLIRQAQAGHGVVRGTFVNNEAWRKLIHARPVYKIFENLRNISAPLYLPKSINAHALLCAMTLNEEAYLAEWVDYHTALGFTEIILFDSSKNFELRNWHHQNGSLVTIYNMADTANATEVCSQKAVHWAAFWEVGSMLILRKHKNVLDLLQQYEHAKNIHIQSHIMQTCDEPIYHPRPFTQRFRRIGLQFQSTEGIFSQANDVLNLTSSIPTDLAVLFRYPLRKTSEYIEQFLLAHNDTPLCSNNRTYTSEVWNAVKNFLPLYSKFEELYQDPYSCHFNEF
jgi:hypothetical protein